MIKKEMPKHKEREINSPTCNKGGNAEKEKLLKKYYSRKPYKGKAQLKEI